LNVEYRQIGEGGGWPTTFQDWAAATDNLRELAKTQPLDLTRVSVTGHSAGAHAALWVAARSRMPKDSAIRGANPLPIGAAVAIDGPGDLAPFIGFDAQVCGLPVIVPLIGGTPAEQPARYAEATPQALLPLGVAQGLVQSEVLTVPAATAYRAAAKAAGEDIAVLNVVDGGHFDIIAPGSKAYATVEPFLVKALTIPKK
jgi:acetyl esterase/lipase